MEANKLKLKIGILISQLFRHFIFNSRIIKRPVMQPSSSKLTPAIFFGHGSPMNAIESNRYTSGWVEAVKNIPKPAAILVISAHWESFGSKVTNNQVQKTIYDFYGFPPELFNVKYQPNGAPKIAKRLQEILPEIALDETWGLDHGAWSVLVHTHPEQDVPVLQLSLDKNKSPREHFEMAKKLQILREENVLIIGSGNIVHNLQMLDWRGKQHFPWAEKFNTAIQTVILENDFESVIEFEKLDGARESVPSLEHFLPLLYILALKKDGEEVAIFNPEIDLASIAMTSVVIGS